ncbi:hypothetical protein EIM50_13580 [Pseudoxanthomonas sp. SGD-10]|nr:hypothetical protein EIM50_13580 [Pseudoxanthomonas sp. SGD-10]
MQRMIAHPEGLPTCRHGHQARHIHDARALRAGGGHLVECRCSHTGKHADYDDALREWCATHGHPAPAIEPQRHLPLANVTHLRAAR